MKHSIELKGASFTLSILKLLDCDLKTIESELSEKIAQAPHFFIDAPLVLDLSNTPRFNDFKAIKAVLLAHQLYLVAITNSKDETQKEAALSEGIPQLSKGMSHKLQAENAQSSEAPTPVKKVETQSLQTAKIINHPVRSGQQIYAANSDLIILGAVSNGAEVAADGNVHVYGALRGRAIAGAKGDKLAQVFCQNLQAELVSIAGHYCLSNSLEEQLWQQACSLRLVENKIITYKL